ncbi:transcriptional regulator [Shigella sonnei]|nr:transcriptional regulator [Shigella sonnei]EFQ0544264.1 transcriptional regulator [Shigella sonnei]
MASIAAWGELVPEGRAMRLQEASGGELQYAPKVYDEYRKAKRPWKVIHENQA